MVEIAERSNSGLRGWLLNGLPGREGPHHEPEEGHRHSWWQVMCLTGVDYFSCP